MLNETARKKRKEARHVKRAAKEAQDLAVKRAKKREDKEKKEKAKRYVANYNPNPNTIDTNQPILRDALLNSIDDVHVLSSDQSTSEGDEAELRT